MKGLLKTVSVILCISLLLISSTVIYATDSKEFSTKIELTDKKVYSDVTIDDKFVDDRVIVVLDGNVGAINKVHSKSFFGTADISNITDLTQIDLKKVSTQDSRSASDSTVSAEQTAMQINTETFRQNRALGKYSLLLMI